ncbi:hypothetical protein [Clostridium cadaveris]|uniref:hypothetical protein n=1 Tax=Clostridium cadaveris TaxID=1529 RepID=UPI0015B4797B|nr:hypothetical protein [Clostridium cadaveris]NWK12489.1 hypothetical protein [Clostridium cadaveris]
MFFIIKTQTAKQAIKEIKAIQDEFKDEVVKIEVIGDYTIVCFQRTKRVYIIK